ncbi:DCTN2 [Cordylochernes scorpioides]|uniref:DCTN2 n=1 Tax=Cordylochernes scorpioides TaxID=51811 RepID=A0ABY6L4H0_9ARAC|nr:DCTN2 [Cordylochernes scorpioides]
MLSISDVQSSSWVHSTVPTVLRALLSQIENVKENLSNLNISSGDTEVPDNSVLSYELYLKPQLAAKSVDPYKVGDFSKSYMSSLLFLSQVVHLEERIKKLETILGHDSNKLKLTCIVWMQSALTTQTNDKSIVAAINILSARTALLDPSNLEQLEGRLGALQQRLATVASSRTTEEAMGGRVSELYDLAKRADTLGANVPGLLDHLLAVKDLHVQALQFSKALTHLDTSQQQMSASLQRSEKLLNEVQKSTVSNLETIQNNISNLEKRLAALK